jgi:hypothetical protein
LLALRKVREMKKIMLLALIAVSAMLVVPTFASANPPLHVSAAGAFTVHGGESRWQRTAGGSNAGKTTTGSGSFETTTTGTIELRFDDLTTEFGACSDVKTTKLPFHLVTLANDQPGILITSLNNHFASFTCAGFTVNVNGNGILGTITSPACGGSSTTATLNFKPSTSGHQQHTTITGVNYGLTWSGLGSLSSLSIEASTTLTFLASRTLTCT